MPKAPNDKKKKKKSKFYASTLDRSIAKTRFSRRRISETEEATMLKLCGKNVTHTGTSQKKFEGSSLCGSLVIDPDTLAKNTKYTEK